MRDWHEVPCTCAVSRAMAMGRFVRGMHHESDCERAKARRAQREALMAKVRKSQRGNR